MIKLISSNLQPNVIRLSCWVSEARETPGGGACPGFSVAISGGGILSDGGFTAISVAPSQKTHGGRLPTPFSSTNQDPLHLSLDNET